MARDKLQVLLTLREQTVDQARQALTVCIASETAAVDAVRAMDTAVQRERAAVGQLPDVERAMEMFATWSARVRSRREAEVAALALAEDRTGQARAVLAAARASVRVVERLAADRLAAELSAAEARERHALDDIAREQHRLRSKT